jgi:hypothetical protein
MRGEARRASCGWRRGEGLASRRRKPAARNRRMDGAAREPPGLAAHPGSDDPAAKPLHRASKPRNVSSGGGIELSGGEMSYGPWASSTMADTVSSNTLAMTI